MAWIAKILLLIFVMEGVSKILGEEKENRNNRVVPKEEESKKRVRRLSTLRRINKQSYLTPHKFSQNRGFGGYGGYVGSGKTTTEDNSTTTPTLNPSTSTTSLATNFIPGIVRRYWTTPTERESTTTPTPSPRKTTTSITADFSPGSNSEIEHCPSGYEKKDSEKRKRRFAVMPSILNRDGINNTNNIIWSWSSVSKRMDKEKKHSNNQVVPKEEESKKRVRRLAAYRFLNKHRFYGPRFHSPLTPSFMYWVSGGSAQKENNKNVANICCFIIKSKTKGILVLTDHAKQNIDFNDKCPSQDCAYRPYLNGSASLGQEICLNDIGSDFSCCSQENGAFCENYVSYSSYYQNNTDNSGWCSKDCAQIANCTNDPQNAWCQQHKMEDVVKEGAPATKPDPPPDDCEAVLKDEPVEQSAEYVPNALLHLNSYRGKRGVGRSCPPFYHWSFTCYKAVYYMLYNTKKHWYFVQKKREFRYFKHECCPIFQSLCSGKKVYKENRAAALCPPYN